MHILTKLRQPRIQLSAGALSLGFSALLMFLFTLQIRDVKEVALPAALALPPLEKRLAVLNEQTELGELQAAIRGSSQEEKIRMHVLPPHDEIDRLIQTMDIFFADWQKQKTVTHVTPLWVGSASGITVPGIKEQLFATPLSFEADVTAEGLSQLLLFIDLAGSLTVNDALSDEARQTLLRITEEENPAAITALEQFLSMDLLAYIKDPGGMENQLLRAFASPSFSDAFHEVMEQSDLPQIESFIGKDVRSAMEENKLWPVRMLRIKNFALAPITSEMSHVAFTLEAISRGQ